MLRSWILGLTAGSILCACANALNRSEAVGRVQKLVSGVVLLTLLLSPLAKPDSAVYAVSLSAYRQRSASLAQTLTEQENYLNRLFIERECGAYILDEAGSLGMEGRVEVRVKWQDNCFVPYSAELYLGESPARERLAALIEAELGIPRERQVWHEGA